MCRMAHALPRVSIDHLTSVYIVLDNGSVAANPIADSTITLVRVEDPSTGTIRTATARITLLALSRHSLHPEYNTNLVNISPHARGGKNLILDGCSDARARNRHRTKWDEAVPLCVVQLRHLLSEFSHSAFSPSRTLRHRTCTVHPPPSLANITRVRRQHPTVEHAPGFSTYES